MRNPAFEPCIPTRGTAVPAGPDWFLEIKHDGYRLMVRRDGARVRCFTRNGHDWGDGFPAIVLAGLGQLAALMLIGFLTPRRTVL
jgi:bifunctional non-homologous end joining protein LigD